LQKLILDNGLLLCGAGKMGGALLKGWLSIGLEPNEITVLEPNPADWLISLTKEGLRLNIRPFKAPGVCIIAVKPQLIENLLSMKDFSDMKNTVFVSIAAGTQLSKLENLLGANKPIVRVMPNTPAVVRKGVSCFIPNVNTSEHQIELIERLFAAVGHTIRLNCEEQMDVVTAISGSGPAYVFYLIEVLTRVGIEFGLSGDIANRLAVSTVSGAGTLAEKSDLKANKLRENVTSPKGTTEAALGVLMDKEKGLFSLMRTAVLAASERSKELGF
tara:strand:- start:2384 stop:3202 length:819 start_codon:yes stop_codon:yes gene_type:complete